MEIMENPANRYQIRRIEQEGVRGGIIVEWQTFDSRRIGDCEDGWCQTYPTKWQALEGLEWLRNHAGDSTRSDDT